MPLFLLALTAFGGETGTYSPSLVSEDLAAWDAEDKNPFLTPKYAVVTNGCGMRQPDEYMRTAMRTVATVQLSRYVVDNKDSEDVADVVPTLLPLMREVPVTLGPLRTEGDLLTSMLKGQTSPRAESCRKAVAATTKSLHKANKAADDVLASLEATQ